MRRLRNTLVAVLVALAATVGLTAPASAGSFDWACASGYSDPIVVRNNGTNYFLGTGQCSTRYTSDVDYVYLKWGSTYYLTNISFDTYRRVSGNNNWYYLNGKTHVERVCNICVST